MIHILDFVNIQENLSDQIGKIACTNTAPSQIIYVLKLLSGISHESKCYYNKISNPLSEYNKQLNSTVKILENMILGESLRSFLYFNSTESSYIKFDLDSNIDIGFICMMEIYFEELGIKRNQCIFSLVNEKSGSSNKKERVLEFFVENSQLVCRVTRKNKKEYIMKLEINLKENVNNFIVVGYVQKKLLIIINDYSKFDDKAPLFKNYKKGTIGISMDHSQNIFQYELTASIFFTDFYSGTTEGLDEVLKLLDKNERTNYKLKEALKSKKSPIKNLFVFSINPSIYSINCENNEKVIPSEISRQHNVVNNVKVFCNRSANETLSNFGGFRTCLLLMFSKLIKIKAQRKSKEGRQSMVQICTGLMDLLHAQFLNNDSENIHYCLDRNALDYLRYILEITGDETEFDKRIVDIILKITHLPFINNIERIDELIPKILDNFVFNIAIWSNTSTKIQVRLYFINRNI